MLLPTFLKRRLIFVALIAAAAALVGLGWLGVKAEIRASRAASVKVAAKPVDPPDSFRPTKSQWSSLETTPVKMMTFRSTLETDGSIAYNDETTTQVFSPFSGRVTRLIAKLGDVVPKGAPLMAIEASEFVQGQNDLLAAAAAKETARSQYSLAEANEKRQHELYLADAGALKDWLQSQTDLRAATGNLRSAEAALAAARNRLRILGRSDAEIATLESQPSGAGAAAETIVTAPIGGTVTQRQVGVGQYITSAAAGATTPVYAIGNLSTVWLVANVREADAERLKVGQRVEVRVLAIPGRIFEAKLAWIAPAIDPSTRRLPVRAEVDNRDGMLRPLMYATFSIVTGDESSALGVPQGAIVYEGSQAHVFVARDDGLIQARTVRTGRARGDMIEVLSGLADGEKVVSGGTLFIDRALQGH